MNEEHDGTNGGTTNRQRRRVIGAMAAASVGGAAALGARDADGRYKVRVLQGSKTDERLVRIGLDNRVRAEVKDGLAADERVVTSDAATPGAAGR